MKTLVIDDLRSVKPDLEPVTYARTPDEGIRLLKDEKWELVCLDHDLGIDFKTCEEIDIWPVMSYIEENAGDFEGTIFYIITSNPWGAEMMKKALDTAGLYSFIMSYSEKDKLFTGGN